jgi:hypothetical protein
MHHSNPNHSNRGSGGHQHNLSTNSLEAERADRISRLAGLSSVSARNNHDAASPQTTPTSTGFPQGQNPRNTVPGGLTPSYFDAHGQPVAATKMSTVGTASATDSVGVGALTATELGGAEEDMLSMGDNETEMDSASGYMADDRMMDDADIDQTRSLGGFEDRMSDDGNASLVGFGEGAGSTVSGPIYHRRPIPPSQGSAGGAWGLERSGSGLSEAGLRRDLMARGLAERGSVNGDGSGGNDTPVSQTAINERREARMVDGVALNGAAGVPGDGEDVFVDTTTRGPVPVQAPTSAIRETQQPYSHQQYQHQHNLAQQAQGHEPSPVSRSSREAAERFIRERFEAGEGRGTAGGALGSPKGSDKLGRFYFEDRK